ncbi:MAG TPA: CehA/McbA family metallohydrolase [Pyrinomonadaceae bacterium]|jgi:hypothetical protein
MRRLLKVFAALLALFALTQAPFVYRRRQLSRLDAAIRSLNSQRAATDDAGFADYPGAIHVHSFLGGHSTGTFAEVVAGARAAGLAFVVMTEHPSPYTDTRAATLSGPHEGVLFIPGNETSERERDRLLTFGVPAAAAQPPEGSSPAAIPNDDGVAATQRSIDRAKASGQLVFVAHPETFGGWQTARGFDGMEVYNLHADAARANRLALFFDGLWSYRSFPQLLWARFHESPTENLRRWDGLTAGGRRVVAVAGNDAHANVGVSLQDFTGRSIFRIKLDPYERSFRVVRTHVLAPAGQTFDAETLLAALSAGHAYVSFDLLCDATGFRFGAANGAEQKTMGDEIALASGVRLRVVVPVEGRVVLVRDGRRVDEKVGRGAEWTVGERGVYRVECYLPQLPVRMGETPWIISNPIYVR